MVSSRYGHGQLTGGENILCLYLNVSLYTVTLTSRGDQMIAGTLQNDVCPESNAIARRTLLVVKCGYSIHIPDQSVHWPKRGRAKSGLSFIVLVGSAVF